MRRNGYGFTLIEVLVVLLILSVVAAFATLSINSYLRNREIRLLTEQLKISIPVARNQALLTANTLGLFITPHSYRYYQFRIENNQKGQWLPIKTNHILNGSQLSQGLTLVVKSELNPETILKSTTISPQIIFFNDGSLTPFRLDVLNNKQQIIYHLNVARYGQISQ